MIVFSLLPVLTEQPDLSNSRNMIRSSIYMFSREVRGLHDESSEDFDIIVAAIGTTTVRNGCDNR